MSARIRWLVLALVLGGCTIRDHAEPRSGARDEDESIADTVLRLADSLVAVHQSRPDTALLRRLFPPGDTLLYVEGNRVQHFTGDSLLRRTLSSHAGVLAMAPRADQREVRMLGRNGAELTVVWTVDVVDTAGRHHPWTGPLTLGVARSGSRWVVRSYRE